MIPFFLILILVVGVGLYIRHEVRVRRNLRRFLERGCTGFQWRRQFPNAHKVEIRTFLDLFLDAFLFRPEQRLAFSPSDRLIDIYLALYPSRLIGDALEFETFEELLVEKYGSALRVMRRADVTLGEIFCQTQQKRS